MSSVIPAKLFDIIYHHVGLPTHGISMTDMA